MMIIHGVKQTEEQNRAENVRIVRQDESKTISTHNLVPEAQKSGLFKKLADEQWRTIAERYKNG